MSEDRKKSLGEFLKSERERRGLTIEQTSSATKIGLKILKQLEADQYVDLPALPFVRGFVRNYGKFLGLDGEKLLAEYAAFLESHANERPKRDAGHSGYAFERPEGEQSRKILWGVMAGMLIFGGAVVFIFKPSLKHKHHGHIDKMKPGGVDSEDETATPNPDVTATPSSLPSGSPLPAPIVSASGIAPMPSSVPSAKPSGVPSATPSAASSPVAAPFVPPKTPLVLAPPTPMPAPTSEPTAVASTVAAKPSPTPSASPLANDDLTQDPLQSGKNYNSREIHTKLVFRTKADVWVRYRCDEKETIKFTLKKDKILVLRGKKTVYFQVSNPDSITIQSSGGAETLLSQSPDVFDFHGNSSVAFPAEARDKMEENFKVGKPLPSTDAPTPSG
jgi:cytoskeletal protein RodZ